MIPLSRARLAVAALAVAVVALVATGAYARSGGSVPPWAGATPSPAPVSPTAVPPTQPPASPTPVPTPTPSQSEDPGCTFEPPAAANPRLGAPNAINGGPVTCEDIHSIITVSWDGAKIKITFKPTDFANGTCELDKKSVKATEPNNAVVKDDGSVEVPYDKDKKVKITIKVEYNFVCKAGDLVITLKKIATIEFTPPDGPVSIKNKNRP